MIKNKINQWWLPALTGLALIALSIFFISQPVKVFLGLTVLFGWLIFTRGGINIVFAVRNRKIIDNWIWQLMIGIFEILAGIALLFQPKLSAESLILFAGFWMMFSAISEINFAFILKKSQITNWWISLISGILTLIFSFFMITNPVFGVLSIVYLTSFAIFTAGSSALILGIQFKKFNKNLINQKNG